MSVKHDHCTPTCAIPNRPAKQSNPLISLQHATSARLVGRTRMLAKAQVPDMVPKRTKYGDMPSEERRATMRWCCGRYETRMPTRMRL